MRIGLLASALALTASSFALADVREEVRFSYSLESGGRISLDNINGDVVVEGGGGDLVEIVAVKRANDQEALDDVEILVDARDDIIRIETRHPKRKGWFGGWNNGGASVNYRLSVPASANLDGIESVNGDVRISGVYGKVKAETVNGSVDVDGASSDIQLATVNGSVNASFDALSGEQKVDCESVNGKISLKLPENADATVSADTVNGGIDAKDFGLSTTKGFVGRSLEGVLGDGSARVKVNTVNGAVKIRKN